ncbi:MAG: hypothetical protein HQ567_03590 [Candidatus Nealsonbacteria bacterium]|nr:hypothetical protein [Candidatus Nealsonbacteria bacterium]
MKQTIQLFAALLLAPMTPLHAADIHPKARDSASLAAAFQQATLGDTIRLPAGTFEITKPIP